MKLASLLVFVVTIFINLMIKNIPDALAPGRQDQEPLFSFGIIADVQYSDNEPAGTRFYRSSVGKLRTALESLKADSVNFVINLGDLIDKDFSSYKPLMEIIDTSEINLYHVTGNHDYSVESSLKKCLPVLDYAKDGYYSFIYEKFRFIFLNGNDISTYISDNKKNILLAEELISTLRKQEALNAVEWNGGIGTKQLKWLTKQLDEASEKDEKVFLMCHFPLFPDNVHNLLNSKEIISTLNNYQNIIAWFNGHNHHGNYGKLNGIHFVTFKGMVETEYENSYSVVEVYNNKIWIKGRGREKSQILAY
jgi:predicted phosphodiesterase